MEVLIPIEKSPPKAVSAGTDRVQRGCVQFLAFMSQYICIATSAGLKAGSLSTNTAQSVDKVSTNKANLF